MYDTLFVKCIGIIFYRILFSDPTPKEQSDWPLPVGIAPPPGFETRNVTSASTAPVDFKSFNNKPMKNSVMPRQNELAGDDDASGCGYVKPNKFDKRNEKLFG